MNKKKKIMFILLSLLLVILLVIGVLSFISYSKKDDLKPNQDFGEKQELSENEPITIEPDISSGDDFVEYIKMNFYTIDADVKLDSDVDGCYKGTGPDGIRYSFCKGASEVSIEG